MRRVVVTDSNEEVACGWDEEKQSFYGMVNDTTRNGEDYEGVVIWAGCVNQLPTVDALAEALGPYGVYVDLLRDQLLLDQAKSVMEAA